MAVNERVSEYRRRMRERGYRPLQIWVPDARSTAFAAEARRQAVTVARRNEHTEDQAFVDAVSAGWADEE